MKYHTLEQLFYLQDGELWRYALKGNRRIKYREKYQLVSVDGVLHKYLKLVYMLEHKVSLRDSVKVGFKDNNLTVLRKKYTYK